jgi:hypothetical protein
MYHSCGSRSDEATATTARCNHPAPALHPHSRHYIKLKHTEHLHPITAMMPQ